MAKTLILTLATLAATPIFAQSAQAQAPIGAERPADLRVLTQSVEHDYRAAFAAARDVSTPWPGEAALAHADTALIGPVLYVRYTENPDYKPSYAELVAWLARFADQPGADRIYAMALAIKPADAPPPPPPSLSPEAGPVAFAKRTRAPYDPNGQRFVERAESAFYDGDDAGAIAAAKGAQDNVMAGAAGWAGGLAAFRSGDYASAVTFLSRAADWPFGDPWQEAAAHYWAARALLAAGRADGVIGHLREAAKRPLTFYGVLAKRQLGQDVIASLAPKAAEMQRLRALIQSDGAARRAAALAQADEIERAAAEIRQMAAKASRREDLDLILAFADRLGVPAAESGAGVDESRKAVGQFPILKVAPAGGYQVDRALMFAIIRQESRFNPNAVSRSNARGLMQLLPSTAAWIAKDASLRTQPRRLFNPAVNLTVGQQYVQYLLDQTGGDLLLMLAAYNAGPGAIGRWTEAQAAGADPLMVLESLPRAETRDYVEKVLANFWLYRQRFGEDDPSIEAAIAGQALRYAPANAAYAAAEPAPVPLAAPKLELRPIAVDVHAASFAQASDAFAQNLLRLSDLPVLHRR